jgi:predicted AAA+ superfamily ATPase
LLLGSASPPLLRQTSESLLGRVEVIEVTPLVNALKYFLLASTYSVSYCLNRSHFQ